jgi:hypothetical protein
MGEPGCKMESKGYTALHSATTNEAADPLPITPTTPLRAGVVSSTCGVYGSKGSLRDRPYSYSVLRTLDEDKADDSDLNKRDADDLLELSQQHLSFTSLVSEPLQNLFLSSTPKPPSSMLSIHLCARAVCVCVCVIRSRTH